jgi:hypothetical protein
MTKKEFKDTALNILLHERFAIGMAEGVLFDTDDISRYKIAQYDEEDYEVDASMPLDEFLDELYEVVNND